MRSLVTHRPLPLLGGVLCLDFVNTIDPRHRPPREDFLASFEQLAEWARYVGLFTAAERRAMLAAGADDPAFAKDVHRRAIALREALYRLVAGRRGERRQALATLNRELERTSEVVEQRRGEYRITWRPEAPDARLLGAVARSAAELLTSPQLARVRECCGEGCGWLFLDTSKAHRRRWCSMAICGNRAKAQRYRRRARRKDYDRHARTSRAGTNTPPRPSRARTPLR
jgi:predicted RNA-binding Zn ribbon-like protein